MAGCVLCSCASGGKNGPYMVNSSLEVCVMSVIGLVCPAFITHLTGKDSGMGVGVGFAFDGDVSGVRENYPDMVFINA